jgi:UDP-N-acetylglucosamine 2-epimerase (non-hydrolysing)
MKILAVLGTRPEAIKLSRLIHRLRAEPDRFHVECCSTGQHRELLQPVLELFSIKPEYDLAIMSAGQSLYHSTARILEGLERVIDRCSPDLLVVQGDTTTTFCGALAGFYAGVPVAHVEAGMRTYSREPFPEEMNRVLVSRLAAVHFPATQRGADALKAEGISANVFVTGNTGIDALLYVRQEIESGRLRSNLDLPIEEARHLILVTTHRRESFGDPMQRTCSALARIAKRRDVQIVLPVHPNPNVRDAVFGMLGGVPNIVLCEPLGYVEFVDLLRRCRLVLTDSGGVQEEAPSFGKPALVLREQTERPEAVDAGTARLVGTDEDVIVNEVVRLLDDSDEYGRRSRIHNPYGDGRASDRIVAAIGA